MVSVSVSNSSSESYLISELCDFWMKSALEEWANLRVGVGLFGGVEVTAVPGSVRRSHGNDDLIVESGNA